MVLLLDEGAVPWADFTFELVDWSLFWLSLALLRERWCGLGMLTFN
jgi:hypothetical protein